MNGIHDMGGMDGFGPIVRNDGDQRSGGNFHSDWEGRVFALVSSALARTGTSADEFRHAIERMPPHLYLDSGYYERWLHAVETLLVERGVLTPADIQAAAGADRPAAIPLTQVAPAKNAATNPRARFQPGDRVRARNLNPHGHTRLPRYVRGKCGAIIADRGVYVFPDTNAHHAGEARQHVYSVEFGARELFGSQSHTRDHVRIDLWQDYLEPAPKPQPRSAATRRKSAGRKHHGR